MNDLKAVATILFRVFGASDIVFAVVYWPYNLLISHYTSVWSWTILALALNYRTRSGSDLAVSVPLN